MANSRCGRCTTHLSGQWQRRSGGSPGLRQMAVAKNIQIYDTTLRDGCQSEDVSLTVEDKVTIAERLDDLGLRLYRGRMAGLERSRRRVFQRGQEDQIAPRQDRGLRLDPPLPTCAPRPIAIWQLLLRAETPVATVVGKTWDMHVREALRISNQANLDILHDTITFLKTPRRRGDFRRRAFLRRYFRPIPSSRSPACGGRSTRGHADCAVRHQRRTPAA